MKSRAVQKTLAEAVDTGHLLEIAAALGDRRPSVDAPTQDGAVFQDFVQTLRNWIVAHYDLPGSQAEQVEKTHLLLHLMRGAPTLGDAINLLERFRKTVWGDRGIRTVLDDETLIIEFVQPARQGVPGLVADLWSLSYLLTEFTFLAGGALEGAVGHVRQPACLPKSTARLLFSHPLVYEAEALALLLPVRHLRRPVVARAEDMDGFLSRLVPRMVSRDLPSRTLTALVGGMIQAETRRGMPPAGRLEEVALRLGLSAATVRRRLAAEGSTFRDIKEQVLDGLAKEWLGAGMSVEATAERLGYSDAFAFRRAFHRRQYCSPSAYKRAAHGAKN